MTHEHRAGPYARETANSMVPLLRGILRDVREAYLQLGTHVGNLDQASLAALRPHGLPETVAGVLGDFRGFLRELEQLGVRLESPELGIVSLPGLLDGREVNFCWKLGEETVRYWYEQGASYDDRRPIDPVLV